MRLQRATSAFKKAYQKSVAESREAGISRLENDQKRTFKSWPGTWLLAGLGMISFGFLGALWLNFGFLWGLFALFLSLTLVWAASRFAKIDQRGRQTERNQSATKILSQLRRGEKVSFSLFLRSFTSSGKLGGLSADSNGYLYSSDIETTIARVMETQSPLVAIGEPDPHAGSGRVSSNDTGWKNDVELLARHARMIFAAMGDSPGFRWEMEWLSRSDLTYKCIFIMPRVDKRHVTSWANIQAEYLTLGWHLPEVDSHGCLFRINDRGYYYGAVTLKDFKETTLEMALSLIGLQMRDDEFDRMKRSLAKDFPNLFDHSSSDSTNS